jgi:hypothetical protein
VLTQRFAFIVKLWSETEANTGKSPAGWRGSVQLVQSGSIRYFDRVEDLPRLLHEMTDADNRLSPTQSDEGGDQSA